ncbi:hypothetical protein QYE88_07785, partial [Enterobacter hormaechei subsp. steigerwaltii]|nr:hypothetical protein [Enterobacter hormaechei subsp. steigerwaltii]
WLMMSLWDALRMNMMISYQELVRTFLSVRHIFKPISYLEIQLLSGVSGGYIKKMNPYRWYYGKQHGDY